MFSHEGIIDLLIKAQSLFTLCYLITSLVVGSNTYSGFNGIFLGIIFATFVAATYYGIKIHVSRTHFGILLGSAVILLFISLESSIYWGQYSECEHTTASKYTPSHTPLRHSRALSLQDPLASGMGGFRESTSFHGESYPFIDSGSSVGGVELLQSFAFTSVTVSSSNLRRKLITTGPQCEHKSSMVLMCVFSVFMFLSYIVQVWTLLYFKNEILGSAPLREGYSYIPSFQPHEEDECSGLVLSNNNNNESRSKINDNTISNSASSSSRNHPPPAAAMHNDGVHVHTATGQTYSVSADV
mmetsp:Transcript_3431/g.5679  ORF Transcript_3431/g.5679 Transcript_3431/m.5679 type:complete len:299 (-) Transcript_3431:227-1123(-)